MTEAFNTQLLLQLGVSCVLHIPGVTSISSHPLIIRLLKGIFHVRPPKPRYEFIWDTELVLQFLKNLHPSVIGLKLLTLKTVTLLTLLSGQRVSTLHQFRLSQMQRTPTIVVFNIQGLLKQSRPTKRDLPITYHAFPHDVALCPVATLRFYLSAREKLVYMLPFTMSSSCVIETLMDPQPEIPSLDV